MFSSTPRLSARPSFWRSLVSIPMPVLIASRGRADLDRRGPRRRRRPSSCFSAPKSVFSISVMPEPFRPAKPRISPRETVKLTSSKYGAFDRRCTDRCACRAARASWRAAARRGLCASQRGDVVLPEHQRDDVLLRDAPDRCADSPAFLPSLSTTMRSETRMTSSSRWLMKMIAMPSRLSAAHELEQALDRVGVERRRHLVQDQDARAQEHRLGDLDRLLLDQRQVLHQPVGVDVEAEAARDPRRSRPASP